jgi:streptogramin lyase
VAAPVPLPLPENARAFTVVTTRRTAQVIATSASEATDIFTCKRWPLHVPPAPKPAQESYRDAEGFVRQRVTAANEAWFQAYRDDLWGRLDWASGECMTNVYETPAES